MLELLNLEFWNAIIKTQSFIKKNYFSEVIIAYLIKNI